MHLISLLSILLRYDGFAKIQKAVADQTDSSRPSNTDRDLFFFGASLALKIALELLDPATELVVM